MNYGQIFLLLCLLHLWALKICKISMIKRLTNRRRKKNIVSCAWWTKKKEIFFIISQRKEWMMGEQYLFTDTLLWIFSSVKVSKKTKKKMKNGSQFQFSSNLSDLVVFHSKMQKRFHVKLWNFWTHLYFYNDPLSYSTHEYTLAKM